MIFDFRSPEKEVVTSQKAVIDERDHETGHEGVFHNEMADAPRAVHYTIRAFDTMRKELRVANPDPNCRIARPGGSFLQIFYTLPITFLHPAVA